MFSKYEIARLSPYYTRFDYERIRLGKYKVELLKLIVNFEHYKLIMIYIYETQTHDEQHDSAFNQIHTCIFNKM